VDLAAVALAGDQAAVPQASQVGRDVGLGQAGRLDDVADPAGAVQELLQDGQAAVVAEAVEQAGAELRRSHQVELRRAASSPSRASSIQMTR
jgi:hypothetical protein